MLRVPGAVRAPVVTSHQYWLNGYISTWCNRDVRHARAHDQHTTCTTCGVPQVHVACHVACMLCTMVGVNLLLGPVGQTAMSPAPEMQ